MIPPGAFEEKILQGTCSTHAERKGYAKGGGSQGGTIARYDAMPVSNRSAVRLRVNSHLHFVHPLGSALSAHRRT